MYEVKVSSQYAKWASKAHLHYTVCPHAVCKKKMQNKYFDKHKQQHTPGSLVGWRLDHVHTTNSPLRWIVWVVLAPQTNWSKGG